jgi:hypothetical protein
VRGSFHWSTQRRRNGMTDLCRTCAHSGWQVRFPILRTRPYQMSGDSSQSGRNAAIVHITTKALSEALAARTRAIQQSSRRGRQASCPILPFSVAAGRRRHLPRLSSNVQFVVWRLRLSKDAVFSPRPRYGVSQNRDRRTSLQLSLSARGVARVPREPFPRIPDRSGMSQSYHCPLDAHIVWRRP